MTATLALIGGAVAGSAAGAALQRWPEGGSLGRPLRSRCSACGRTLAFRDLVPIVSWIALAGRCRTCHARIDGRLPVLEASAALLAAATVSVHGLTVRGVVLAVAIVAVLTAAFIDVERRIIPDRLTRPLTAAALVVVPLEIPVSELAVTLRWAVGLPLALYVVNRLADRLRWRRPIGGGDVKLLVPVLALSGIVTDGPAAVLLLTIVAGGTIALVGLAAGRLRRRSRMPLAPAIAVAFLGVVLAPEHAPVLVAAFGGSTWLG